MAPPPETEPAEPADLRQLSVDDVVRHLIPDAPELAQVVGLAGVPGGARVSPWAGQQEIAQATGMTASDVAAHTERLRARWAKSVPALTPVRDEVMEILREHGGIMGGRGLAAGLLARRGSLLGDPAERLRVAAICVRAAIDTEERREKPRLARSRGGAAGTVIIALTEAAAEDGSPAPRADDLFAYAELLGDQADLLAARDPLPGVTEIKQALREVMIKLTLGEADTAGHLPWLSDTDLVLLAAAASRKSAATARLELYPRDLSPERALKISQAGSFLGGASDTELARRVLARFPDLASPPRPEDIARLLTDGYDAIARHRRPAHGCGQAPSSAAHVGHCGGRTPARSREMPPSRRPSTRGSVSTRPASAAASSRSRPASPERAAVIDRLALLDGVTAVNVTSTFITLLKGIVEEHGRPRWDTVLAADDESAPPAAKTGFARLLNATWDRLDAHIRATAPSGIVLLHDATPLTRYLGGPELLARLAGAARDAGESPHGLWLLCPMQNPKDPPRLDGMTVGVIPGDAEQVVVADRHSCEGGGVTVELKALQQQVKKLEADLTPTGLADPKLKAEWQDARAAERTASAFEAWLAERVTQVAVGWVLSTVFVRFCEDNGLIEYPFIAGPGERTALARDLQQAFFERHPERGDRDWLKASFDALSVSPVAKALFDEHNPMWSILPSPDQAKALLDFWRQTGEDGELRYDLTDPEWDTRFLGDLYQDLSESARKTYALLQTPEFVEEFILNYTLDPAIEEFGLEPEPPYGHADLPHRLRVIDPACGSGHFLLGAFRRLLGRLADAVPNDRQLGANRQRPVVCPRRRQEPLRCRHRPLPPHARRHARRQRHPPVGQRQLPDPHSRR